MRAVKVIKTKKPMRPREAGKRKGRVSITLTTQTFQLIEKLMQIYRKEIEQGDLEKAKELSVSGILEKYFRLGVEYEIERKKKEKPEPSQNMTADDYLKRVLFSNRRDYSGGEHAGY